MMQLEKAWTVNCAVDSSSISWVKLTKSLQQAFNPEIDGFFLNWGLNLKIHLCPSYIGESVKDAWCCQPRRV